jgi:hypothetical protein
MSDLYKITTTSEEYFDKTCVTMQIELSREMEKEQHAHADIHEATRTCIRAIHNNSFRIIDKLFFNFLYKGDRTHIAKAHYLDLFLSGLDYDDLKELRNSLALRSY